MSFWTHIVATIHVDTHKETDNLKDYIENALKYAPAITGSERNASVFINIPQGSNVSTNQDCDHCVYRDTIKYEADGIHFTCDLPKGFECPTGEYQTCAVITVCGDLRDRTRDITKDEYKRFRKHLHKELGFSILNHTAKIEGD